MVLQKTEVGKMGCIRRERGVLKLVHPGRHIEIHKKPITAAEVMRMNPRHCITRPDVFQFPWIVVKPESVLLPGTVFFIVPNHTIYNLLKAKGQSSQSFSSQQNNHFSQDGNLEFVSSDLSKSCLRRPDSIPKLVKLKVSFDLPVKEEKQQRGFTEFQENFSG